MKLSDYLDGRFYFPWPALLKVHGIERKLRASTQQNEELSHFTVNSFMIYYQVQQFPMCGRCQYFLRCNFLAERLQGSLLWKSLRASGVKTIFGLLKSVAMKERTRG